MPSVHCRGSPTCPYYVQQGVKYCPNHIHLARGNDDAKRAANRIYNKQKRDPIADKFYSSNEWKATRELVLGDCPSCSFCSMGIATQVHHDKPLRERWDLRLDRANLIAVCGTCHKRIEGERRGNKNRGFI